MSRRCAASVALFLLAVVLVAPAQQASPRVAVVPLNPVGVSQADAAAFSGLLEVALVKTELFDVIEQSQIGTILEAQERSVSDCTDEKCAIEFGKLLAAEQILLGSISTTGGQFFLAVKLIDVATGRSIRADSVSGASVKELSDTVELLAFKLAGLTYRTGGKEQVASAFSQVFVETVPDGAEVYLNGLSKGRSPLLLERVPVGKVAIEARKSSMYASAEIEAVAGSMAKLRLDLVVSLGNVFIKSPVREGIEVLLDGGSLGELGTGLKEGIPAGEHEIVLIGGGYYWEGRVSVQTGKAVTVEVYPREVGSLEYVLPEGAQAELEARDYRQVLRGRGRLQNVPAQSYSVRVTGADYEPSETSVTVARGEAVKIAPVPMRTEAYRREAEYEALSAVVRAVAALAAEGRQVSASDVRQAEIVQSRLTGAEFRFEDLEERIETLRAQLAANLEKQTHESARADLEERLRDMEGGGAGRGVRERDIQAAEALSVEIAGSPYATEELRERGRTLVYDLKVRSLEELQETLEARLERRTRWRRGLLAAGGVTLGVGVAAGGGAVASYLLGAQAYADYLEAGSETEAVTRWTRVSSFTTLFNVTWIAGSSGVALGSILLFVAPRTARVVEELAKVERELEALRSEGR